MGDCSIGDLSRQSGVKVPAIRYHEQIGLVGPPARAPGNQRRYDKAALEGPRFIAQDRAMGSLMESVKVMLRLSRHTGSVCADLDDLARGRLAEVDERIGRLRRHRHGTVGECRIIEVLSDHDECATEH